jgi:dTDP-4-amino-4,6-dideoxygalactose transaminase
MKVPYFIPWINSHDKKTVLNSLGQRWLTNGIYQKKFENNTKKFIGSKFASAVGSATQGLHLSTRSIDIGPHDEVIVPTLTFAATANCVVFCGGKPVFADVDYDTFNIKPENIKKNITKKTKAIIPVHYGGQSCNMDEILEIAGEYNLKIIEDCAHALGSTYKNKKCGVMGVTGCFSFYPTKVITTGEGGMITTNNPRIYKKIELLKSQAMNVQAKEREQKTKWKYDIVDLGYNYRMDEIRAALGYSQLNRVNKINRMRIKIAEQYNKLLRNVKGVEIPVKMKDRNHIYHLYSIKITKEFHLSRDEVFDKLSKKGIGTSVQYTPLHKMSYYKNKFKIKHYFPNANKLENEILCLPIFPTMEQKQIEYVCNTINKI